jgi:hypothetical protein
MARVGVGEGLTLQRPQQKGFAPMQLRTQPSNLSPVQLQRVNTIILEPSKSQSKNLLLLFFFCVLVTLSLQMSILTFRWFKKCVLKVTLVMRNYLLLAHSVFN